MCIGLGVDDPTQECVPHPDWHNDQVKPSSATSNYIDLSTCDRYWEYWNPESLITVLSSSAGISMNHCHCTKIPTIYRLWMLQVNPYCLPLVSDVSNVSIDPAPELPLVLPYGTSEDLFHITWCQHVWRMPIVWRNIVKKWRFNQALPLIMKLLWWAPSIIGWEFQGTCL